MELVLTAVGKHLIMQLYDKQTPATLIDRSALLRAEWVDTQVREREEWGVCGGEGRKDVSLLPLPWSEFESVYAHIHQVVYMIYQ